VWLQRQPPPGGDAAEDLEGGVATEA